METKSLLLKLLLAIPAAMIANIIMGAVISKVKVVFDMATFKIGIVKAIGVYISIGLLFGISVVIPEVTVANVGTLSVLEVMIGILSVTLGFYVYEVLKKLIVASGTTYALQPKTTTDEVSE